MKSVNINTFNDLKISIAMKLLEDVERAERELDNFMETNSSLEDLEMVRYLQEQVQYRYSKYLNFIGLSDKEVLN